jgi:hypothetical protein
VPRLEVPVRTALRFTTTTVALPSSWYTPESVMIEFEGREFGWLALSRFEHQHPDEPPPGPTVTTIVSGDTPEEWREAQEAAQRFLSSIAFAFDTRVESRPTSGGSGSADLLNPYGAVEASDTFGHQIVGAPERVEVHPDPRLRVTLAVYREGLSAASPFYRFLSFWNVLEAVFPNDGTARNAFIRDVAPSSYFAEPVEGDIAAHFRDNSRHAIAHIVRVDPADVSVDPDLPEDRERLDYEARWLQDVARKAAFHVWPEPVRLVPRPGP